MFEIMIMTKSKKSSQRKELQYCPLCDGTGLVSASDAYNFMLFMGFTIGVKIKTNLIKTDEFVEKIYNRVMKKKG